MSSKGAEIARRYRERRDADPDRRTQYLEKERDKWTKDRETGKKKGISELSEREKRAKRKKWSEAKKQARARNRASALLQSETPPDSPAVPETPENQPQPGPSRQRRQGESIRRSSKRKLKKQIEILEAKLAKEKTKTEKYKKRFHRAMKESVSPRAKVNSLLGRQKVNSPIKRALLFHTSLIEDIRTKYANAKTDREKQLIAKVVSGNILKKYKLQKHAQTAFGYSKKRAKYSVDLTYRGRKCVSGNEIRKNVTSFFLRDDVSRMTTGRKQTVTRMKKKMQKRLLTDTMKNLHRRFLSEHIGHVSYTSFCRLRPFWVVTPSASDRDTCLCKKHENLQFMANALQSQGFLSSRNIEEMCEATMCDPKSKVCAYGECSECLLTCHPMQKAPGEANILFCQWMTEKVTKEEKVSNITVKREMTTTEHDLTKDFQERLLHFRRHVFNIKWQFDAYRELRRSLKHNESLLHIDFSENYVCKYGKEIQSVHFGGSHQQASLHTGVLYTAGEQVPHTFCSISPSRRHDPVAIWAHLDPILKAVEAGGRLSVPIREGTLVQWSPGRTVRPADGGSTSAPPVLTEAPRPPCRSSLRLHVRPTGPHRGSTSAPPVLTEAPRPPRRSSLRLHVRPAGPHRGSTSAPPVLTEAPRPPRRSSLRLHVRPAGPH
ncbi:hypothetical protein NHX12_020670 [Muraenolepis orangiensis]|uniref:Uncharacterized protein n=1 Tax=Muraenolepis orangiensis TaxID=630683 RepID=A0A9Q0ESE7_9TELE|nr:hypothetical protein NHX12_020670 [Muraenolepis orangiensis]